MQWKALDELDYGPGYKVRRNTINVEAKLASSLSYLSRVGG